MKNYQISPGGCGTYALKNLFGDHINTFKEQSGFLVGPYPDGLFRFNPHQRCCESIEEGSRAVYVYGNPFNIILSYFRRNFLVAPYHHCQNIGGDLDALMQRTSWNLEAYFSLMENDPFKLREHFYGWFEHKERSYDIMFVRYESLDSSLPEICKWYNFDESKGRDFVFKKRNSDWSESPKFVIENLERLYGQFNKELSELPNILINP